LRVHVRPPSSPPDRSQHLQQLLQECKRPAISLTNSKRPSSATTRATYTPRPPPAAAPSSRASSRPLSARTVSSSNSNSTTQSASTSRAGRRGQRHNSSRLSRGLSTTRETTQRQWRDYEDADTSNPSIASPQHLEFQDDDGDRLLFILNHGDDEEQDSNKSQLMLLLNSRLQMYVTSASFEVASSSVTVQNAEGEMGCFTLAHQGCGDVIYCLKEMLHQCGGLWTQTDQVSDASH